MTGQSFLSTGNYVGTLSVAQTNVLPSPFAITYPVSSSGVNDLKLEWP